MGYIRQSNPLRVLGRSMMLQRVDREGVKREAQLASGSSLSP